MLSLLKENNAKVGLGQSSGLLLAQRAGFSKVKIKMPVRFSLYN